jgi:transposase
MRPGIELRSDYDAARLRALARLTRNAGQSRRLLALAEIYEGGSRTKAARVGGVGLQTVRDWVVRFNAHGPEALIDGKAPGPACKLQACHREALLALVESGPTPAVHGVVRWRLKDLVQWVWDEFRIAVSETTLGRELRTLGYRKLSARPRHHAKSEAAVAAFKKSFLRVWRKSRPTRPLASRSRSGLPMRRASGRRTRSHAVGPNAARGPRRHGI